MPDLPLFTERAEKAVRIHDMLRLPDVPGQPLRRDAAGDWFRDSVIRPIFGSLDDGGVRHIRKETLLVPKKNDKTTGGAAVMLTALLMNERPNAEMVYIGPTQKIANRAFQQSVGMIRADKEGYLQKRFHIIHNEKMIRDRLLNTTAQVKTFDANIVTGSAPIVVLVDELHLLSKFAYAADVLGQLEWGQLPYPEAFILYITTQSFEAPAGVFKTELEYARGVRDGRIIGSKMLPVLYEFPESMQRDKAKPCLNPKNWHMVHPNLGRSVTLEVLTESFNEAVAKGEDTVRRWGGQNLNLQTGTATHDGGWRGAIYWDGAADLVLFPSRSIRADQAGEDVAAVVDGVDGADARRVARLEEVLASLRAFLDRCEVAVVGGDGGGADDLLGLCVAGREKKTGTWLYWFHAWVDEKVLADRPEIAERLRDFARDGDLTLCSFPPPDEDKAEDYVPPDIAEVTAVVKAVKESGLLPEENAVGLDTCAIGGLVDAMAGIGLEPNKHVIGVAQGYKLSSAIWTLERKLRDGTARHGGQPMMTWCVGNAKSVAKGNAVLITKETAGKAKIDPLCAGFNATMLLAKNPAAKVKSFWERAA